jgi:hypothetical protein
VELAARWSVSNIAWAYIRKRTGEAGDPWGSPLLKGWWASFCWSKAKPSQRWVVKLAAHLMRYVGSCRILISSTKVCCLTLLKAPSMSCARMVVLGGSVVVFLEIVRAFAAGSIVWRRACIALYWAREPICVGPIAPVLVAAAAIRFAAMCSRALERHGRRGMGLYAFGSW